MIYELQFTEIALEEIRYLKLTEIKAYHKLTGLLEEIKRHPEMGTGKPERLKYQYAGYYSRRISLRHRLVYHINRETGTVLVVSVYGHYEFEIL